MALVSAKWRLRLLAAALALMVIVIVAAVFGTRAVGYGQSPPAPQQPIAFSHVPHVSPEKAGAQCVFCHRGVVTGAVAGIPSVEQCMFCHRVVGQGNAEVEKVRKAWEDKQPIDWVRVHRVPDSVHFVHEPHIRAQLECATCHGDVGSMTQVRQVKVLRMGECLACHRARGAPTECSICHY